MALKWYNLEKAIKIKLLESEVKVIMFKKIGFLVVAFLANVLSVFAAAPQVTDVVAKMSNSWSSLVEVTCKVSGLDGAEGEYRLYVEWIAPGSSKAQMAKSLFLMDGGCKVDELSVTANGEYKLFWNARADLGEVEYENMIVRVSVDREKVQLWENGPYWATTNIGAKEPYDAGLYFWWGDTIGYKREGEKWVAADGSTSDFSFKAANAPTYEMSITDLEENKWITSKYILTSKYDAAQVKWGGDWRMPTKDEFSKLKEQCDWSFVTSNGVSGCIIRGKGIYASNSVFLPCVGKGYEERLINTNNAYNAYYWASILNEKIATPASAFILSINSSQSSVTTTVDTRYSGLPIRPVQSNALSAGCESKGFLLNTKGVLSDGDVRIESFRRVASGDVFEVVIRVDGAQFGDDVAEGVILEVFSVEGCSVLDLGEFSADNVEILSALVDNGKIKLVVKPKINDDLGVISYNYFFFRIKKRW